VVESEKTVASARGYYRIRDFAIVLRLRFVDLTKSKNAVMMAHRTLLLYSLSKGKAAWKIHLIVCRGIRSRRLESLLFFTEEILFASREVRLVPLDMSRG